MATRSRRAAQKNKSAYELSEILVLCSVGVAIGLVRDEVQAQISLLPCLQRPVTYRIRNTGARVLIVIRAYGRTFLVESTQVKRRDH